ncbi:MAG: hypothetical protein A2868_04055 [Candidatus Levybacteria bacterium RIFCSPHIGHO2_01_FULL_40_15b]|nr:MAG: hypothetical protein A2868_04055 [Candidatus Levybacteria bacterium RIFCSPHIGHO2_01_FULL_40_15b]
MNLFARIISFISNPVLLSIPFSYALVFKSREDFLYALAWTFVSILFASLVGVFVVLAVRKGVFSDFDISKRQERTPIFIFTGLLSILYFLIVFLLNGPKVLLIALGALLFGVIIADIINRKIKASIHLAVFSSFSVIMGILYGGIFWALLLIAPLVAWSRVKLKKHEPLETIVGGLVGIIIVLMLYVVVKYVLGFYAK